MKLSVVSGALGAMSLVEALGYLSSLGVTQFELGVGGYPGTKHADAKILSVDAAAREELIKTAQHIIFLCKWKIFLHILIKACYGRFLCARFVERLIL